MKHSLNGSRPFLMARVRPFKKRSLAMSINFASHIRLGVWVISSKDQPRLLQVPITSNSDPAWIALPSVCLDTIVGSFTRTLRVNLQASQ